MRWCRDTAWGHTNAAQCSKPHDPSADQKTAYCCCVSCSTDRPAEDNEQSAAARLHASPATQSPGPRPLPTSRSVPRGYCGAASKRHTWKAANRSCAQHNTRFNHRHARLLQHMIHAWRTCLHMQGWAWPPCSGETRCRRRRACSTLPCTHNQRMLFSCKLADNGLNTISTDQSSGLTPHLPLNIDLVQRHIFTPLWLPISL